VVFIPVTVNYTLDYCKKIIKGGLLKKMFPVLGTKKIKEKEL